MKRVPNILSLTRILLALLFILLYLSEELVWSALAIGVFAVAAVTDYFDGYIARNYEARTHTGIFLDPLADKFLTFSGFICLPIIQAGVFPWWIVLVIVARDILITVLRSWANWRGFDMHTSNSAKIKTFTQMTFLYVALLAGVFMQTDILIGHISLWMMNSGLLTILFYGVMIVTVYTGIEYLVTNQHLFKRAKPETD